MFENALRLLRPTGQGGGIDHSLFVQPLDRFRRSLLFRLARRSLSGRNNGQQHVIWRLAAEMQRGHTVENLWRAIMRIVVQERAATGQFVLEIRKLAAARTAIRVVLAADGESNAISGRRDDRGWPNLDIEFDNFAVPQWLLDIMQMVRPMGQRPVELELAVGGPQPALGDRRVGIDRALVYDFLKVRREHPHDHEQIGVAGG